MEGQALDRATKFIISGILVPALFVIIAFALLKQVTTVATRELTNNMQRQSAAVMERAKAQQVDAAGQAAEARRAQLDARAAQTRTEMEAARLEQQAAARKEAAWQVFFKPKKVCDNPPDSDTQVECGNAYMRAKREFEDRWTRGEIQ